MIKKFLNNCKKPEGKFGKWVVSAMNKGHAPLCLWAFEVCPKSRADGIDYSEESVACSRKVTRKFADRCSILCGDAMRLPYRGDTFGRAVSFESIYFWPDPARGLKEIYRVLKKGGKVMIASEMTDPEKGKFWAKRCEGMTIYTAEQLAALMGKAGFSDIKIHKTRKVWCAVEGIKP